ncbi:MAG: alanine racemase [Planctomycetota bacterium]
MHLPRVWARIDLRALRRNLEFCRQAVRPGCKILGVVKADAYGHGAVPIADALEQAGIAMLGVGDSHEAIQLRSHGIRSPIIVLGAVVDQEIPELIEHGITPTVHSPDRIRVFEEVARRHETRLELHVLIDTGMSRLGVAPSNAVKHLEAIARSPHLQLAGIGTHLASPLHDRVFTDAQLQRFDRVLAGAKERGIEVPTVHVASSSSLVDYPQAHYDMVRLGGALYGIAPGPPMRELRPILSLHTQVVYLRDLPPGTPVSYHGTFRTRRKTRLATLPVGYHDGYHFQLSGRARVLIRGKSAPTIGRVTMDYTMVDVTDVPEVKIGDRVTLLGRQENEEITAHDLARWAGSVPYEIPSQFGQRVRREYRGTASLETKLPEALRRRTLLEKPHPGGTQSSHSPYHPE